MPVRMPQWAKRLLRGSNAIAIFGAWAVNLHVPASDRRQTTDVDIVSRNAKGLAARIAKETGGKAQKQSDACWSVVKGGVVIADVFQAYESWPPTTIINGYRVVTKEFLIRQKEEAAASRRDSLKGFTDMRDLMILRGEKGEPSQWSFWINNKKTDQLED